LPYGVNGRRIGTLSIPFNAVRNARSGLGVFRVGIGAEEARGRDGHPVDVISGTREKAAASALFSAQ
jgi:hypothetical protein